MKLDTSKKGYAAIWKVYEYASIDALMINGELGSGEVFQIVRRDCQISRASIIFFLNRLVDENLAIVRHTTGKGGARKLYTLTDKTWSSLHSSVADKFLYKLWEIFPDNSEKLGRIIK